MQPSARWFAWGAGGCNGLEDDSCAPVAVEDDRTARALSSAVCAASSGRLMAVTTAEVGGLWLAGAADSPAMCCRETSSRHCLRRVGADNCRDGADRKSVV